MNHMPGAVVWGIMCEQEGAFYMCRNSFEQVGRLLREAVDAHGGAFVVTPEEIKEHLRRELGQGVEASAIEHFPLALRVQCVGISPYDGFRDGSVVILRDTSKFLTPQSVLSRKGGKAHVTPGAKFALNERALTSA